MSGQKISSRDIFNIIANKKLQFYFNSKGMRHYSAFLRSSINRSLDNQNKCPECDGAGGFQSEYHEAGDLCYGCWGYGDFNVMSDKAREDFLMEILLFANKELSETEIKDVLSDEF